MEFADDRVADRLLDHGTSGVVVAELEKLLRVVERLKCRCFVPGSIKHYELVK